MRARGQGATEYLVLLAVVLIIALVAIALLGFFPGTASDAQETESRIYWQSASPIAIIDNTLAYYYASGHGNTTTVYLRLRNVGTNPLTITKVLGGNGYYADSPSVMARIGPGEENCIGTIGYPVETTCTTGGRMLWIQTPSTPSDNNSDILRGADTICATNGKGRLLIRNFGFEYTTVVEGQILTKRQIGKPLAIDCSGGSS